MWPELQYEPPPLPISHVRASFALFVEQSVIDSQELCVADTLQAWIEQGDGLDWCPTYASFLLLVVVTIDEWSWRDEARYEISNILIRAEVDGTDRKPLPLFPDLYANDGKRGRTDDRWRYLHPIMSETWFNFEKHSRQAKLNDMIRDLYERRSER
jgi:hypothetical protein